MGRHAKPDEALGDQQMIINTRKDLDAAPAEVRSRFMASLAASINKYEWSGIDWVLVQDESSVVKFGFTSDDFPDAPIPEKPDYNPDERALEQEAKEARSQRDALLAECDWTQVADAPVDAQAWAAYRQALRDVPEQSGFPGDIDWPSKP
jgi:hypothetical protein